MILFVFITLLCCAAGYLLAKIIWLIVDSIREKRSK